MPSRDALLAVLLEESLTAEDRADPAFMAAHHAAETDVALLRHHLTTLADTLTHTGGALEPDPSQEGARGTAHARPARGKPGADPSQEGARGTAHEPPAQGTPDADLSQEGARGTAHARPARGKPGADPRRSTRRPPAKGPRGRRPRPTPATAAATAAVAAVLSLMGWLLTQSGEVTSSAGDSAAAKQDQGPVAAPPAPTAPSAGTTCPLLAEGDVIAVRPAGRGQRTVTLRVTRHHEPPRGPAEITFRTDAATTPVPREGLHVLVGLPAHAAVPDLWVTGRQKIADRLAHLRAEPSGPSPTGAAGCR